MTNETLVAIENFPLLELNARNLIVRGCDIWYRIGKKSP